MTTRRELNEQEYTSPKQLVSTDTNWVKNQLVSTDTTDRYDNDFLFEQLDDLVNPAFKPWYCKMFYRLGKDRVLVLASQARSDGKQPPRLFSKLLKEA